MTSPLIVHFFLFLFNFSASVTQGLTGFGDAIVLHVVWYTATVISPDSFNATALGDSPVRAVTLLVYCRVIFSTPVLIYMNLHSGVLSLQMILGMAIPSTLTALAGVFIFEGTTSEELKLVLGISGLVFAAMCVATLATRWVLRRRKLRCLGATAHESTAVVATTVIILPEMDAVETDLQVRRNSSFARHTSPHMSDEPPSQTAAASPVFVSIATGSPFRRKEAEPRAVTESGGGISAPPLTPSKLSPLNTMSYTRVRVNRNLDENGSIKLSTKVGASVASAVSGVMGSITGVDTPPHVIFTLVFDVPQYLVRVNLAMQSIPSSALRFICACSTGLFTKTMIPLFITSLVSGCLGFMVGVKLGKVLGPRTYRIFFFVLLLLSSLVMMTENVAVLISSIIFVFLITVASAVYEHRQMAAKVQQQVEVEEELEKRRQGETSYPHHNTLGGVNGSGAVAPAHRRASEQTDAPVSFPTPLPPQPTADATVTPPSTSVSSQPKESNSSMNAGNSALTDTVSVSTGVSSRTSSRIRRAEQRRPPSLFKDLDAGAAAGVASTGAAKPASAVRGRLIVFSVPAAGDIAPSACPIASPKQKATVEKHGVNAEEVKRWVALQNEEIGTVVRADGELVRKSEKREENLRLSAYKP